jgi:hypothetical protein
MLGGGGVGANSNDGEKASSSLQTPVIFLSLLHVMTCVEPLLTTIFYCLLLFGPNGSLYVVVMLLSILKTACLVIGKPLPSFHGICICTAMYICTVQCQFRP